MFELIESVSGYSVAFAGDTIVDEYHYVKPLGKSPKENLIPVSHIECEQFEGGTHAAAAHLATFCRSVTVASGGCAVTKSRYIDKNYLRKMFEVQYAGPFRDRKPIPEADITVVTDFGHGFVNDEVMRSLYGRPFVAVNAQTNASNIGFNLITKYQSADYVVVDEFEARLAAGDRASNIRDVMFALANGKFKKMVVTLGNRGAIGWDGEAFHECSAYTDRVLDTMGAGDAFFAITAPMAKTGSMPDLLRIGNAAGALKTQIVGHRKAITKNNLIQFLRESA